MRQWLAWLLLLCCGTAVAEPKNTLTWLFMDWPPFFNMQGDTLIGGTTGEQMKLLFAALPEYVHVTRQVSVMRLQVELQSDHQVCSMPLQKTPERKNNMLFTEPVDVALTTRLYAREAITAQLGTGEAIELDKVAALPQLRGVVHRARSYGPYIDRLLATPGATPNLQRLVLASDSVLKMLESDRIEYVIEYPVVVRYWESQQRNERIRFRSYRIAGADDFSLGYIACSKTAWGAEAVARINKAFKALIQRPDFPSAHYQGLSEAEQRAYQRYWQQYILGLKPATR